MRAQMRSLKNQVVAVVLGLVCVSFLGACETLSVTTYPDEKLSTSGIIRDGLYVDGLWSEDENTGGEFVNEGDRYVVYETVDGKRTGDVYEIQFFQLDGFTGYCYRQLNLTEEEFQRIHSVDPKLASKIRSGMNGDIEAWNFGIVEFYRDAVMFLQPSDEVLEEFCSKHRIDVVSTEIDDRANPQSGTAKKKPWERFFGSITTVSDSSDVILMVSPDQLEAMVKVCVERDDVFPFRLYLPDTSRVRSLSEQAKMSPGLDSDDQELKFYRLYDQQLANRLEGLIAKIEAGLED